LMAENVMQAIGVEKVTLNIGAGEAGEKLEKAKKLLEKLTKKTPVYTLARTRNPTFGIRKGMKIGVKVTLRDEAAIAFLEKGFGAVRKRLSCRAFDRNGNFAFGIHEYIDFPGMKYDPGIGLLGLDICVTLSRAGRRVKVRRKKFSSIGKRQLVTADEARAFVAEKFGVTIE